MSAVSLLPDRPAAFGATAPAKFEDIQSSRRIVNQTNVETHINIDTERWRAEGGGVGARRALPERCFTPLRRDLPSPGQGGRTGDAVVQYRDDQPPSKALAQQSC